MNVIRATSASFATLASACIHSPATSSNHGAFASNQRTVPIGARKASFLHGKLAVACLTCSQDILRTLKCLHLALSLAEQGRLGRTFLRGTLR